MEFGNFDYIKSFIWGRLERKSRVHKTNKVKGLARNLQQIRLHDMGKLEQYLKSQSHLLKKLNSHRRRKNVSRRSVLVEETTRMWKKKRRNGIRQRFTGGH